MPLECLSKGRLPVLLVRSQGPRQQPHLVGPVERVHDLPLGLGQMDERCTSHSRILRDEPERPTQSLRPCTSVIRICTCLFSHARDHLLAQPARSTRRCGENARTSGRNRREQKPPTLPLFISSDYRTDARRLRRSPALPPTTAGRSDRRTSPPIPRQAPPPSAIRCEETSVRLNSGPSIDWGWHRLQCETYLLKRFGVHWPKSYCPAIPIESAG